MDIGQKHIFWNSWVISNFKIVITLENYALFSFLKYLFCYQNQAALFLRKLKFFKFFKNFLHRLYFAGLIWIFIFPGVLIYICTRTFICIRSQETNRSKVNDLSIFMGVQYLSYVLYPPRDCTLCRFLLTLQHFSIQSRFMLCMFVFCCFLYTTQQSLHAVWPSPCVTIPHTARRGIPVITCSSRDRNTACEFPKRLSPYPFDTRPVETLCQSAIDAQKRLPLRRTESQ